MPMHLFLRARSVGVAAILGATVVVGSVTVPMVAPAGAAITCSSPPHAGVDYYHCNLAGVDFAGGGVGGGGLQGGGLGVSGLRGAGGGGGGGVGANFSGTDFA